MDSSVKRTQLLVTLAEQVERLKTSDGWRAWLDAASRFHDYSLRVGLAGGPLARRQRRGQDQPQPRCEEIW